VFIPWHLRLKAASSAGSSAVIPSPKYSLLILTIFRVAQPLVGNSSLDLSRITNAMERRPEELGLLDLPREVRDMIWYWAMIDGENRGQKENPLHSSWFRNEKINFNPLDFFSVARYQYGLHSLLQVNRQVHIEAEETFQRHPELNTMDIGVLTEGCTLKYKLLFCSGRFSKINILVGIRKESVNFRDQWLDTRNKDGDRHLPWYVFNFMCGKAMDHYRNRANEGMPCIDNELPDPFLETLSDLITSLAQPECVQEIHIRPVSSDFEQSQANPTECFSSPYALEPWYVKDNPTVAPDCWTLVYIHTLWHRILITQLPSATSRALKLKNTGDDRLLVPLVGRFSFRYGRYRWAVDTSKHMGTSWYFIENDFYAERFGPNGADVMTSDKWKSLSERRVYLGLPALPERSLMFFESTHDATDDGKRYDGMDDYLDNESNLEEEELQGVELKWDLNL
jgi:hypothetical protein